MRLGKVAVPPPGECKQTRGHSPGGQQGHAGSCMHHKPQEYSSPWLCLLKHTLGATLLLLGKSGQGWE